MKDKGKHVNGMENSITIFLFLQKTVIDKLWNIRICGLKNLKPTCMPEIIKIET